MTTITAPQGQAAAEFSVEQSWQSDRRGPVRWLFSHLMRHKLPILGILLGAFGNGIGAGLLPIFVGQGFDAVIANAGGAALLTIAFWLIASQLMRAALMLLRNFSSEVIGQRIERDIRDELYLNLLGKSMSYHDSQATGDLMARATNDVREINLAFNPGLNLAIGSSNFLIAPFVLVPPISPQLLLVPAVYVVLYVYLLRNYLLELQPNTERVRRTFGDLNATLAEGIDGIEVVKSAAQETKEINRFDAALKKWRDAFIGQGDVEAKFLPLLLLGVLQAAGLFHSLFLFQNGVISVGDVIAFNGMLLIFQFPTFAAQFAYSFISVGVSSARRVLAVMNAATHLDQNVGGYSGEMDGSLSFRDVTFSYNGSAPALQDISFSVEPGQTVAIVGQTGAGKSTIAKLINRMYDVDEGELLVGGHHVREWDLAALRRQISIIEQDIYLFSRTVADNIAFGCPGATREDVIEAAKMAQAHDFILNFQDGYDTVVGERGVTLSGGQRQRLAIARAFLTNPKILVLDDSTSAIDSATEDRIQRAIEQAAQGRTTLLITHRLSQIRWADLIVVLRQGRVAMVGRHEDLLQESEAYRNLFT